MARRIGRKTRGRRRGSKRRSMRKRRSMPKRGGNMGLADMIEENKDKFMEFSNFFGDMILDDDLIQEAREKFSEDEILLDYFIEHQGEIVEQISKNVYENRKE